MPLALLETVLAQPTATGTLRRALASGHVHHAYVFDGLDGVGKERAAFGLAQALVCERRPANGSEACGHCPACGHAIPRAGERQPVHPDVIVLERGLYEPTAIGRRSPETQDISVDQVRTLVLSRAAFAPHEGRARVFIVRRAEEFSVSASNALLKTLEEPRPGTHFVLLTSTLDALLPTIRSRAQRIRFGPLPDATVGELLVSRGISSSEAARIARMAGGSMSFALALADPKSAAERDAFVAKAMDALRAPGLESALELADIAKKSDKAVAITHIEAFAMALAVHAKDVLESDSPDSSRAAERHAIALATLRNIDANASLQLAVEAMCIKMRGA
jgi:DNA polymerase-3 subunit delta'